MTRQVTEQDFRMPQFRDAHPEDYEFDSDGNVVRKDRWKTAINDIRELVGIDGRRFEIDDVVNAVSELVQKEQDWITIEDCDDLPARDFVVDLKLVDGCILVGANFTSDGELWDWRGMSIPLTNIMSWRRNTAK